MSYDITDAMIEIRELQQAYKILVKTLQEKKVLEDQNETKEAK